MHWWDIRGEEPPQARPVSVAFYRSADDVRRVGVRLATDSLQADDIAAVVEEALGLPTPPPTHPDGVHALLLYHGTSIPISSPRLNSVGAALLDGMHHDF